MSGEPEIGFYCGRKVGSTEHQIDEPDHHRHLDLMYSDSDILKDVVAELKTEPGLRDDDVAVGVREGVVTLAGFVDSYADKWRAERIASKVKGVKAVVNDLEVRLPSGSQGRIRKSPTRPSRRSSGTFWYLRTGPKSSSRTAG